MINMCAVHVRVLEQELTASDLLVLFYNISAIGYNMYIQK